MWKPTWLENGQGDSVRNATHCKILNEVIGTISDFTVVWFDRGNGIGPGGFVAISQECSGLPGLLHKEEVPAKAKGALLSVTRLDRDSNEIAARLQTLASDLAPESAPDRSWRAFACAFEDGTQDVVLIRTAESEDEVAPVLNLVWPSLRQLCLQEMIASLTNLPDDAMLWLVQRKVNASVLVLDEDCNLLRANAAGTDLLQRNEILRVAGGRLCGTSERATASLHRVVREILQSADKGEKNKEYVLLLRSGKRSADQKSRAPIPISLTPFKAANGRQVLIALLPMPPERKRIEHLAQKMGLTPSEARVAALIRAGHSNREAAKIAGLKVETFNTYAKRALAKMNVSGRADMAQMLTWQAAVERLS